MSLLLLLLPLHSPEETVLKSTIDSLSPANNTLSLEKIRRPTLTGLYVFFYLYVCLFLNISPFQYINSWLQTSLGQLGRVLPQLNRSSDFLDGKLKNNDEIFFPFSLPLSLDSKREREKKPQYLTCCRISIRGTPMVKKSALTQSPSLSQRRTVDPINSYFDVIPQTSKTDRAKSVATGSWHLRSLYK